MNYKDRSEEFVREKILSMNIRELPVRIDDIAKGMGIKVKKYDFHEDVSGVLVIDEKGNVTIGYNPNESDNRIRFSIAHEIGHFVLHSNNSKGIFVDKLMFRKNIKLYSKKEEQIEIEANYFAANLLMPKSLILEEVKKLNPFANDEDNIKVLAGSFGVSVSAMTYRLINLGIYTNISF